MKKIQHSTRDVATASWWATLKNLHSSTRNQWHEPDYPDRTHKRDSLKVGTENCNAPYQRLYCKGFLNADLEQILPLLQTQSRWKTTDNKEPIQVRQKGSWSSINWCFSKYLFINFKHDSEQLTFQMPKYTPYRLGKFESAI